MRLFQDIFQSEELKTIKYKDYIAHCKKEKKAIIVGFILLIINGYTSFRVPFLMSKMISNLLIINNENLFKLVFSVGVFSLFYFIQGLSQYISDILFKKIGTNVSFSFAEEVYDHIILEKNSRNSTHNIGEIITILDKDIFSISENGLLLVYKTCALLISLASVVYYMLNINESLSAIVITLFLLLIVFQKMFNSKIEKIVLKGRVDSAEYSCIVQELANQRIEILRANSYNYHFNRFKEKTRNLLDSRYSAVRNLALSQLINSSTSLMIIVIIYLLGGWLVSKSVINLSDLITFSTYSGSLGGSLNQIPTVILQFQVFNIAYERVRSVKLLEKIALNKIIDNTSIEEMRLNKVRFQHGMKVIIANCNYKFRKGHIYVITGGNGKGKTTILNLIFGEYQPISGEVITLGPNGKNEALRRAFDERISYSSSQPVIFNDSIINNITLGNSYNPVRLEDLLESFDLKSWVERSSNGINSNISNFNLELSSGQMQKLLIIRSLMKTADILIYDEIEKHLDETTKEAVMKHFHYMKKDKIIILTSHDEFIIENSDYKYSL